MDDVLVGLLVILLGAVFCFRGYLTMRVVIPLWGALIGFFLGAGLVASYTDENLLSTALGWLVGIAVALLFGALAYLYYEISVVLAMAGIGFSIGTGAMVALGVRWTWVVVLAGLAVAMVLAVVAIVADLPTILLTVLSALAGAVAMVAGAMLVVGTIDLAGLDVATVTDEIDDQAGWYVLYVASALAGVAVQARQIGMLRGSLRDTWTDAGGRHVRRRPPT